VSLSRILVAEEVQARHSGLTLILSLKAQVNSVGVWLINDMVASNYGTPDQPPQRGLRIKELRCLKVD